MVQRWLDGGSHEPLTDQETAAVVDLSCRLHAATGDVPNLNLTSETFDTAFVPVLQAALRCTADGGGTVGPHSDWVGEILASKTRRRPGDETACLPQSSA